MERIKNEKVSSTLDPTRSGACPDCWNAANWNWQRTAICRQCLPRGLERSDHQLSGIGAQLEASRQQVPGRLEWLRIENRRFSITHKGRESMQSFVQSGVLGSLTLFLDFTMLSMGSVTTLLWQSGPFVALLNLTPLYLLYHALRAAASQRQVQEMKAFRRRVVCVPAVTNLF
jgi:hypothetical protein